MSVLVFDTETNGAKRTNGSLDIQAQQIVQLSWVVLYPNGTEIQNNHIIRGATFIDVTVPHTISITDTKNGDDFGVVIDHFMTDVMNATHVVGHNIFAFDIPVVCGEMRRCDIPTIGFEIAMRKKGFCTMYKSKYICNLRTHKGTIKNPKLSELYTFFFGSPPTGQLHDALYDCQTTLACYKRLKNYFV
jgi:DNA polymerase III epsilon subunit-like protein